MTRHDRYEALWREYYDNKRHPTCANFAYASRLLLSRTLPALLQEGDAALDVGAGRSLAAEILIGEGRSLDGLALVDASAGMLSHSRKYVERGARALLADAHQLPFRDAVFDVAVASLGDAYNTAPFWDEMARLVRGGGSVLFTTPSVEWADRFRGGATAADFAVESGTVILVPSFVLAVDRQEQMAHASGLLIKEIEHVSLGELVGQTISHKFAQLSLSDPVVTGYVFVKR